MCPLRPRHILPVVIAFEGDVVVVLESERQRWTETVGVDDSLSRELVKTTASVLADRGRLAHAAPLRARPRGAPEEREKWSNEHQRLFGYRPTRGRCQGLRSAFGHPASKPFLQAHKPRRHHEAIHPAVHGAVEARAPLASQSSREDPPKETFNSTHSSNVTSFFSNVTSTADRLNVADGVA